MRENIHGFDMNTSFIVWDIHRQSAEVIFSILLPVQKTRSLLLYLSMNWYLG